MVAPRQCQDKTCPFKVPGKTTNKENTVSKKRGIDNTTTDDGRHRVAFLPAPVAYRRLICSVAPPFHHCRTWSQPERPRLFSSHSVKLNRYWITANGFIQAGAYDNPTNMVMKAKRMKTPSGNQKSPQLLPHSAKVKGQ